MGIQHLPILLLLLGVAVLVFGPKRLPELGHGLGKAIKEFKQAGQELTESVNAPADDHHSTTSGSAPSEAAGTSTASSVETSPRR